MTTARPATTAPQTPEALAKAAEAKARRAARKAARAAAPPPERDAAYDRYSLADPASADARRIIEQARANTGPREPHRSRLGVQ